MGLLFPFLKYECSIMPSKTKCIAQGVVYIPLLSLIEGKINARIYFFIHIILCVIDCRRNDSIFQRHDRS